jgi:uncharacterized membrane protein
MPSIHEHSHIKAEPEAVFDLITGVGDFCRYTDLIEKIKEIAPGTYRWRVRIFGMPLQWDVLITENVRPKRFAWRSIRGVDNSGCYALTPTDSGTQVSLTMSYQLANPLLEMVLGPVTQQLIRKVGTEILAAVKQRLESQPGSSPS